MQGDFRKKSDYLITQLKCYVKENKTLIVLYIVAILFGFALGIVISSFRENLDSKYNYIVLISEEEYKLFGVFTKVVLLLILGMFCCYTPIFTHYLNFMPYLVLFYTAYRFGGRIVGLIVVDKIIGVICILTYTIPLYLAILLCFMCASCITNFYSCKCGKDGFVCKNINKRILKNYLVCLILAILIIILVCIIIPSVAKFIIVV